MELKIGKKIVVEKPKNMYIIECDACHGDGDHSEVIEMEFSNTIKGVEKLKRTIPILDEMISYTEDCKMDQFCDIKGYSEFVSDNWPRDITDGCGNWDAQLDDYNIFFYDKDGDKFKVEIVE